MTRLFATVKLDKITNHFKITKLIFVQNVLLIFMQYHECIMTFKKWIF